MADSQPRASIIAGDSWAWTATFGDYPASDSWNAECVFQRPGAPSLKLTGVASGASFVFTLTRDESGALEPGVWTWATRVWKAATSKIANSGETRIRPDPTADAPPTHAEKCLALVKAAMEDRLEDVQEAVSILGQDITKIPVGELERLLDRYQVRVNKERVARRLEITGQRRRRGRVYLTG